MQDFVQQTELKLARAEEQAKRLSEELEQSQERLNYEKRQKEEIIKGHYYQGRHLALTRTYRASAAELCF